jgi:hypothetical protein
VWLNLNNQDIDQEDEIEVYEDTYDERKRKRESYEEDDKITERFSLKERNGKYMARRK